MVSEPFVIDQLLIPARVLWVLLPAYIASSFATFSRGKGPPMDFGRFWPRDGRRVLGTSKTWVGFFVGSLCGIPFGLLEAYLMLLAPPDLALMPQYGPTLAAALPLVAMISFGAMAGDALGSFLKRRLGRPSGARSVLLDPLPLVLLPIGLGLVFYPSVFVLALASVEAVVWLIVFTVGLHMLFNRLGYRMGTKRVPW
ncbi:MAG: CDP-archaeol synthase [Thermoplasmata archaeon]